jgi:pimeloyl-ACP methyl ester carboxylesterase
MQSMVKTPRPRLLRSTTRARPSRGRNVRVSWAPPHGIQLPGTLAVRTLGTAGPPVLLLHGLASSGQFWGADYDSLANNARLIVPDLLGFGRSPCPQGGYGPNDHADAVAAALHRLRADDQPALVVGHSVGALVGLRVAARHPSLVAAVLCFGPPLYRDYAAARHRLARLSPMTRLFGLDTRWAELACKWLCQRHRPLAATLATRIRPDLPEALTNDAVQHSWESFSETLTRLLLTAEATTWLDQIDVPIHLIAGEQDPVVDIPLLLELEQDHPAIHVDIWTDGRHDLPLIYPDRCRSESERDLNATRAHRARRTHRPRNAS